MPRFGVLLVSGLMPATLGTLLQAPEIPVVGQAADTVAGAPSQVGSGVTGTTETVVGALPRVPDAPLPAMAPPVSVPVIGSSAPHTADPAVCGILGGIIVLNWVIACCCETVSGGLLSACAACVECLASICSVVALLYAAFTGLFRAWLGGQAVSGWCLAMAIISTLQLLACVCICCCASCGSAILGETAYKLYVEQHSKHVMGSHMHELVHKHKPGGTHPITEGHLPYHDEIHNNIPLAQAGPAPKQAKEGVKKYGATETEKVGSS
jgi:hypothetical protein